MGRNHHVGALLVTLVSMAAPQLAHGSDADVAHWRRYSQPAQPLVTRPPQARLLSCSLREALCVHADGPVGEGLVADTLASAERALASMRTFGLPPPLADAGRGGTLAFDLYLQRNLEQAAAFADPLPTVGGFDRASAFGLVPTETRGAPCSRDAAIARTVAQATLLSLDGAQNEGTLAMQSSYLATLAAPCHATELEAIDAFQRAPERAITGGQRQTAYGGLLFPWYLDVAYGTGGFGTVMNGLIGTSCQRSNSQADYLDNEPDIFDALRDVLPPRGSRLGDLLVSFAVARAFLGDRSDGAHLPDTERFGELGRVRFEWSVSYDSLPKRLAPLQPVEATGATYLWLDLPGGGESAGVLFAADWETSFVYQWALVRVDERGRELGRHVVGGLFGHDHAQLTVQDLAGAAGLLIVGTNLGHDDRSKPFDPDIGPARAAGYTVTLHKQ